MLAVQYGLRDATVTRLEQGHTNASFLVASSRGRYVLRRAWAGKSAGQVAAEEHVLRHLAAPCDVPRIVPALDGAAHVIAGERIHHLFALARGTPGPRFLAPGDHHRMRAAMVRLGALHRALAAVPIVPADAWLAARLARLHAAPPLLGAHDVRAMLARVAARLPAPATRQWLHGDYHLGNLLWQDDEVSGVVDFDDVALGDPALEAGLALFALARQPAGEDAFAFDAGLYATGRAAYGGPIEGDVLAFCAAQILIHLEAAQRGSWTLEPGIGFWPCWNTLSRA